MTLPGRAGGATVDNAVQMAEELAKSEGFTTCMAKNLLAYSLAEGGAATQSCAMESIVENFAATDGSFASLITEIVAAQAFTKRAAAQEE